jgi:hypothetical protein
MKENNFIIPKIALAVLNCSSWRLVSQTELAFSRNVNDNLAAYAEAYKVMHPAKL